MLRWGVQPGRPGQGLWPRAGHTPVIHMLAVRAEAARVVIVPLALGQLFILLFIGCGNHVEPNDGCPHGLAKHVLCSGFEEEWKVSKKRLADSKVL